MRMSAILTASLASVAHARIVGFGVPETIKAGDTFDAIILSENYIQSVTDVVIAFGYSPGVAPAESLGNFISASDLVAKSNQLSNFNETVTFPATTLTGDATFTASLMSLYGAGASPTLTPFNVSVTIGDETSSTYVYGTLA